VNECLEAAGELGDPNHRRWVVIVAKLSRGANPETISGLTACLMQSSCCFTKLFAEQRLQPDMP
jgi:hypothetical protein